MRQSEPNQLRGAHDQAETGQATYHPVFRLFIKAMVNSSGFPSASEIHNETKTIRGYNYHDAESALVARVKYLHLPVAELLAQREKEWASKGIPEEARQAIKNALSIEIEEYLKNKDPKEDSEEKIRAIVQGGIDKSERDVLRNIDVNED